MVAVTVSSQQNYGRMAAAVSRFIRGQDEKYAG